MSKLLAALVLAMMVSASVAAPKGPRRMLLAGGGGGWDGGIQTEDIQSENDAIAGIETAVQSDQYGSTYGATNNGFRDAYAATYPEDNAGQFWLNAPAQSGK